MKIGVVTLAHREVSFPTFCGMVGLASLARGPLRDGDPDFPAMGVTFEYFFRRGFSAAHNATKLLEVALAWPEPIDALLFVEADIAFFPKHVARVVSTWDTIAKSGAFEKPPIVGAIYPSSGEAAAVVGGDTPQGDVLRVMELMRAKHFVERVRNVGFGFVLVPAQLFRERAAAGLSLSPENVGERYEGGDVLLCEWARGNGYPIFADFALDVGHLYAEPRTLKELLR